MTGQNHNPEKISENIINHIKQIAKIANLDLSEILDESALLELSNLLFSLKEKTGNKAVVLVDEYDTPITDKSKILKNIFTLSLLQVSPCLLKIVFLQASIILKI